MKKALIVVDMLNDFINPSGKLYCGPTASEIVPNVKNLIDDYRKGGFPIIFLADAHEHDDKEFDRFPSHCIDGTDGANVIDALNFQHGQDSLIKKTRYSGFYNTSLEFTMETHFGLNPKFSVIEVCGVCTSICCMLTVAGLANRDYSTMVRKDCVADFNPEAHYFALEYMKNILGTEVI